jgi:VWFA-related protein
VIGPVAGVVAESQIGNIMVQLPPGHNADVALHSANGSVRSTLPVTVFGLFDSHNIQAKIGQGGSPILLRTMSGNVSLLPLGSSADLAAQDPTKATASSSDLRARPELRTGRESDAEISGLPPKSEKRPPALEGETIRLEAPLVNLNVSVSDSSGRAIADLTKEDFTIYENGVRQEITHFSPSTTPFDLVLLLDLSGSTEKKVKVIKRAAQRFVDLIRPEDRLAVYAFRRRVEVIAHLTNDRELLKHRIENIGGGRGGTAFYDSLWFTVEQLERESGKRKAIVVMTDGVDNSIGNPESYPTKHTFEEVINQVEESDIIVYPIYLDTEYEVVVEKRLETRESYAVARRQLSELAERTAGSLFRAARVEDLEGVYEQVASELRTVYSLAYNPSNATRDGTWRRIQVKVNRPTARVKTKRGYYAR